MNFECIAFVAGVAFIAFIAVIASVRMAKLGVLWRRRPRRRCCAASCRSTISAGGTPAPTTRAPATFTIVVPGSGHLRPCSADLQIGDGCNAFVVASFELAVLGLAAPQHLSPLWRRRPQFARRPSRGLWFPAPRQRAGEPQSHHRRSGDRRYKAHYLDIGWALAHHPARRSCGPARGFRSLIAVATYSYIKL